MTRKARKGDQIRVLPLAEATGATGPFVATVPGVLAPIYPLDLPARLRHGTRERIARRQIAERLGLAEDELDIRPVGTDPEWTRVLVCDRTAAEEWRSGTGMSGCTTILPDYLTLPSAEGVWVLKTDTDRIVARLGPHDGFSADSGLALIQLRQAAAEAAPKAVLLLTAPSAALSDLLTELNLPAFRTAKDLADADHPIPVQSAAHGSRVNLLEPADAAVQKLRGLLRRWTVPAALAVLALALWSAGTLLEIDRNRDRLTGIRQSTDTLLRSTFVPSGPILDVRLQVSRRLGEIGLSTGYDSDTLSPVALFRRAAGLIATAGVVLQSVNYRPQTGLEAAITSPDFARVDSLADSLRAAGLSVAVLESRAEDGGQVRARLQLGDG